MSDADRFFLEAFVAMRSRLAVGEHVNPLLVALLELWRETY